ncbi:putative GTPase activating protein for Arf-domain-containing protein [Schizophyllum commune]
MSRQDKATTERHARMLRELVKRPENKVCADCKRNDPRWASWNVGVFLCIRCSGIHRAMGTHISKVKSVDLDIWTPEQMASIQKWGNRRANAYWEAHLKQGHVPPEHKMESFIRSKYESRRWAMDGPPPADPSVFDGDAPAQSSSPAPVPAASPPPAASAATPRIPAAGAPRASVTRQPQAHQLLSAAHTNTPRARATPPLAAAAAAPAATPAAPKPADDLFSLDFHNPSPAQSPPPDAAQAQAPKKDVKQDILSLFSAAPAQPVPVQPLYNQFAAPGAGAAPVAANPWGAPAPQVAPNAGMQQGGAGIWGAAPSGGLGAAWGAPAAPAQPAWGAAPVAQPNVWGAPSPVQQQPAPGLLDNSASVWGSTTPAAPAPTDPFGAFGGSTASSAQPKKDDAFGDLWGSFK